ncbi:MAG: hypothetical protein IT436_16130 [Phycisphaerales bacterium]|nr:hypothetical protein [Phycisphaerales bacterium]
MTTNEMARVACIYRDVCELLHDLDRTSAEGVNGRAAAQDALRRLPAVLNQYLESVPADTRAQLDEALLRLGADRYRSVIPRCAELGTGRTSSF